MSDASDSTPSAGPSLRKKPRAEVVGTKQSGTKQSGTQQSGTKQSGTTSGAGDKAKLTVPIPLTINLACIALVADVVLTMVRALSLRLSSGQLTNWLIDTNNTAKTGKKVPYTTAEQVHDLAQLRSGALIQGVVLSIALILLAGALRRVRGAGTSRWALIIIIVLTSGPLYLVPVSGWPAVPKYASVLTGAASVAVIVLILLPQSLQYFRACKAATRPEGAPARPGLFGPRPAAGGAGTAGAAPRTGGAPASAGAARPSFFSALLRPPPPRTPPPATAAASDSPSAARTKAKVRTGAAMPAKDAEPSRPRGKAKSRKS